MSLSRRSFVKAGSMAAGGILPGLISSRGLEAATWEHAGHLAVDEAEVLLNSNENPLGPGSEVIEAIREALQSNPALPGRYPHPFRNAFDRALWNKIGVRPKNVIVGCGSRQILETATQVFTTPERPLVTPFPSYEACPDYARKMGIEVKNVPLTSDYRPDLDRTLQEARGAGMVFLCNPSNPTSTLVPASDTSAFILGLLRESPETRIVVDEAYFEYVTDPGAETMIPLALENQRVVVTRTFSKLYGMAGLRLGYAIAHKETIREMAPWLLGTSLNSLGLAAARVALRQPDSYVSGEKERNRKVRDFTVRFLRNAGCRVADSQTNFVFADVGMPIDDFRRTCLEQGIRIGRPFPPFQTHARISLGTMQEMERAVEVFSEVFRTRQKVRT